MMRRYLKNKWFWRLFALKAAVKLIVVAALFLGGCATAAAQDVEGALQQLDREIEGGKVLRDSKERQIAALRGRLARAHGSEERFNLQRDLFREYSKYQNDSAYRYATEMMATARRMPQDPSRKALAYMAMMESFNDAGLFKEVDDVLDSIREKDIPAPDLVHFYDMCAVYYGMLSSNAGFSRDVSAGYRQKRLDYLNRILGMCPPGSFQHDFVKLGISELQGLSPLERARGYEAFISRSDVDDRQRAFLHSLAGCCYREAGEEELAVYHLARSAAFDIRSCTRETTAAKDLAQMMHNRGDLDRASRYIHQALDDAQSYNSRLRQIEINAVLPEIENSRYGRVSMRLWVLTGITVSVALLLALAVWLAVKLRSKTRKLHESNAEVRAKKEELEVKKEELEAKQEELEASNRQLTQLNITLKETAEIKDRYIVQSLIGNTDFVNSVDDKIHRALVKLKLKQPDEATRILQKAGTKDERERMYASFDSAFLKLFPNFPDAFNALFPEHERVDISAHGSMPMEVRIYALMRLGIERAEEVAKYLNLSVNTVYVYKTRLKSRSVLPKESFDEAVLSIPKP